MKNKSEALFTPAQIRRIEFDGTVSSVHEYLRQFIVIIQRKVRKKGIADKQFRLAVVTSFVQTAFVLLRIDLNIGDTLRLLSKIVNDEAKFEQKKGWSNEKILDEMEW